MKKLNEILNNGKLQILTKIENEEQIQIRAYYTDPVTRKRYWCKFTSALGWEHVAVSPQPQRGKTAEWDVMCKIKDIFWEEEECCIEYHPRKSQYVNNNETCLHIWKPLNIELPEPPTILLGFQDMSSSEASSLIDATLDAMSMEEKLALADKIGIKLNRKIKRGGEL